MVHAPLPPLSPATVASVASLFPAPMSGRMIAGTDLCHADVRTIGTIAPQAAVLVYCADGVVLTRASDASALFAFRGAKGATFYGLSLPQAPTVAKAPRPRAAGRWIFGQWWPACPAGGGAV